MRAIARLCCFLPRSEEMDHLRAEERQNVQILKAHNEDYVMYTSFEISMWQPIEVLLGAPRPAS